MQPTINDMVQVTRGSLKGRMAVVDDIEDGDLMVYIGCPLDAVFAVKPRSVTPVTGEMKNRRYHELNKKLSTAALAGGTVFALDALEYAMLSGGYGRTSDEQR